MTKFTSHPPGMRAAAYPASELIADDQEFLDAVELSRCIPIAVLPATSELPLLLASVGEARLAAEEHAS